MAKDTKGKICRAALKLFSENQYETVSVAEVCRQAEVSNGVFYRYFNKKEEIFRSLIDNFLIEFERELSDISGYSVEEKLLSFIKVILEVGRRHQQEITIFREGQYRLYGYEDTLRDLYIRSAESVFSRVISEVEYLYIVSGLRFCSIRALYHNRETAPELIRDFILNGVFSGFTDKGEDYAIPEAFTLQKATSCENSYEKLIRSGTKLFGKSGFHNIGVADITRDSQLAVGTFYSYFESKEQFLNTIVIHIGEKTRHYLSEKIQNHDSNRLEQEIWGIWYFLNYFNKHLEYYSIVREAEFVGKDVVGDYYDAFEAGYIKNLSMIDGDKRQHAANFLIGLAHYTGIEVLHRQRINNVPDFLNMLSELLRTGIPISK